MAKSKGKGSAKKGKGKATRLVWLPGHDGAHYAPLASGKWLRSRRSEGTWEHAVIAKPAVARSGSAGPRLTSTRCRVDGNDYINLGNGRYWRLIPNSDGTFSEGGVDESEVPPSCRST